MQIDKQAYEEMLRSVNLASVRNEVGETIAHLALIGLKMTEIEHMNQFSIKLRDLYKEFSIRPQYSQNND